MAVAEAQDVTQVFLNYRSADEPLGVGMLDQILSDKFGPSSVFFASKSIELGALWEPEMFTAVRESVAVLVIMGRFWLTATDEEGVRLLDKEEDFVRREILLAMAEGKPVIPVRLGVPNLRAADLPDELASLAARQSISIQHRSTGPDIDRLVAKLREQIPELRPVQGSTPRADTARPGAGSNHAGINNGSMTIINANQFRVRTFNAGSPSD
jgi:hypothetical protein